MAIKDEKLIKLSKGVSNNYSRANGPSILKSGSFANTIVPAGIAYTFRHFALRLASQTQKSA